MSAANNDGLILLGLYVAGVVAAVAIAWACMLLEDRRQERVVRLAELAAQAESKEVHSVLDEVREGIGE